MTHLNNSSLINHSIRGEQFLFTYNQNTIYGGPEINDGRILPLTKHDHSSNVCPPGRTPVNRQGYCYCVNPQYSVALPCLSKKNVNENSDLFRIPNGRPQNYYQNSGQYGIGNEFSKYRSMS
jgi:hypothetical protein